MPDRARTALEPDRPAPGSRHLLPNPLTRDELSGRSCYDRIAGYLREAGAAQEVDAVIGASPPLADARLPAAVKSFNALPEAAALAAPTSGRQHPQEVGRRRAAASTPRAAGRGGRRKPRRSCPGADRAARPIAVRRGDYEASLKALAGCAAGPVDAFFDGVMVNADDPALRANRLGCATLHAAMNRVADLSRPPPDPPGVAMPILQTAMPWLVIPTATA